MKRLRIDFNPYNRDRLREVLDEQLSQGFKLNRAHPNLGYLTFMPIESNEVINYEVVCRPAYDDYFPEPWIDCGSVSYWGIFRFDGDGEKPFPRVPEPTMSEEQYIRKCRKRKLVCGILFIILGLLYLGLYIPEMIKSAAFLVSWLARADWLMPIVWLVAGICHIDDYFHYPQKKTAQDNTVLSKRKWFATYVLSWIFTALVFALIFLALIFGWGKNEKPIDPGERLPFSEKADKRLPFPEKAETGTVVRSLAGKIYRYNHAFLYDVRSEKLAERLFEEAAEDKPYGEWRTRRFVNCDIRTEISADKYENLDRMLSCTEDHDFYELTYNMVVVLHGDEVFGYCYDKEEYTEEEFLTELNNFYGKAVE